MRWKFLGIVVGITIAAGLLFPGSSSSAEVTYEEAYDLNQLCTAKDINRNAMCDGYILGIFEVITNTPVYGFVACVPPLSGTSKALERATAWLAKHPKENMRPASWAIAKAFAEIYPCPFRKPHPRGIR